MESWALKWLYEVSKQMRWMSWLPGTNRATHRSGWAVPGLGFAFITLEMRLRWYKEEGLKSQKDKFCKRISRGKALRVSLMCVCVCARVCHLFGA